VSFHPQDGRLRPEGPPPERELRHPPQSFHPYGGHYRGEGPFPKRGFKYIILQYLKDQPSHGYEIIRALEDRFQGLYVPSAGTIYPGLQILERDGFVTAVEREGKKVYSITPGGLRYLEEHTELGKVIDERLNSWASPEYADARRRAMREFGRIGDVVRWEIRRFDAAKLERVRAVLARAHQEIEDILGD
jgi:DNA-binding PadR family transcriptional regulator